MVILRIMRGSVAVAFGPLDAAAIHVMVEHNEPQRVKRKIDQDIDAGSLFGTDSIAHVPGRGRLIGTDALGSSLVTACHIPPNYGCATLTSLPHPTTTDMPQVTKTSRPPSTRKYPPKRSKPRVCCDLNRLDWL